MRSVRRAVTTLLLGAAPVAAQGRAFASPLTLASDNTRLVAAFSWAKAQATAYAFDGDPVGPWFEAALPGREAFCMRDVAHQVMGAHALGLQAHVRNMLQHFAANATEARDWASLWEIDRHGNPAHADYRNDHDFWYNLPANFDVLDAAWRMHLWSGDQAYLRDSTFLAFYRHSVTDYVARWQLGADAIMTRERIMNRAAAPDPDAKFAIARGIPGYNEEDDDFTVGLDLLAAQYAGYAAWARILEARGDFPGARAWLARAADVRALVNTRWWDPGANAFHDYLTTTGALRHRKPGTWNSAALYWPVANDAHVAPAVDALVRQVRASRSAPIEEQSHHPEVLWRYGAADLAFDQVLDLARPTRERREYPEVSFSVVGALVTGLMGVGVDPVVPGHEGDLLAYFTGAAVTTLPQLPTGTRWAELRRLPVRANDLAVRHEGNVATVFTNLRGPAVVWQAMLPGRHAQLLVAGRRTDATPLVLPPGREVSVVRVVVAPGTSVRVRVPG